MAPAYYAYKSNEWPFFSSTTTTTSISMAANNESWMWVNTGTAASTTYSVTNTVPWLWSRSAFEEDKAVQALHEVRAEIRADAGNSANDEIADALVAAHAVVERVLSNHTDDVHLLPDDVSDVLVDLWMRTREEEIEHRRRIEAERAQRAEAKQRAEALLESLLDDEQLTEWREHRRVTERAPSGRVWRLFAEWAGGAALMDEQAQARRATLCIHPRERVPEADVVVGLIAALRGGDEEHLIEIAVLHSGQFQDDELAIRRARREERMQAAAIAA